MRQIMIGTLIGLLMGVVGCGSYTSPTSVVSSRGVDAITIQEVLVDLQFDFTRGTITAFNNNANPMAVYLFDATSNPSNPPAILRDGFTRGGHNTIATGVALRAGMTIHVVIAIYSGYGTALLGEAISLIGLERQLVDFQTKNLVTQVFEGDITVQ